jgi:CRISPR system Cascade subunit CasA
MHDLLEDHLIDIRTSAGERQVCLPQLLALLSAGEVDGYAALRAHQADPWHVFLVQIAASVLSRRPTSSLPVDPAYWREGLLELADGKSSAWHLVVDDVAKPAFLQHPLSGQDDFARLAPKAMAPDELDVLVTAKDHDVKMARAEGQSVQAWLYALLTCQTTSGFLGVGNFGALRMNGGLGSRLVVTLTSDPHPSRRFAEEVLRLAEMRSEVAAKYGYRSRGIVLTWLAPWNLDGHQLDVSELEPWFIEAVRRVRLVRSGEGIAAYGAASNARQIGPKNLDSGDVGDPWIPIDVENEKKGRAALTVVAGGWTPKLITKLLFQQGFELTALQVPRPGEGTLWFMGSVFVRGKGKTEGFHRFAVPVPSKVRRRLLHRESAIGIGEFAQKLLGDAATAERAVGSALMVLAEGGPEHIDFEDRRVNERINEWTRKVHGEFSRRWETSYFPTLWRAAEVEDTAPMRVEWQEYLVAQARETLRQAERSLPLSTARRYRALVRAETMLQASLRSAGLAKLRPRQPEESVA